MYSRPVHWKIVLLTSGWLLGHASGLLGGEKVQFSIPTEREEQPIDVRSLRPAVVTSTLRDSAAAVAPGTKVPIAVPRLSVPLQKDQEKNKNWLTAPTETEAPSMEDFLGTEKFASFGVETKKQPTAFLGVPLETKVRLNPVPNQTEAHVDRKEKTAQFSLFATQAEPGTPTLPSWDSVLGGSPTKVSEHATALNNFWSHNLNVSALTEQIQARKNAASDLWQIKNIARSVNTLAETTQINTKPPTPLETVGTDALSRTRQTSFGNQWDGGVNALAGTRPNNLVESVNTRALGQPTATSSAQLNTPPVYIKPQPAVLPFPPRPGQVFR